MDLILDIGNTRVKYLAGNNKGYFEKLNQKSAGEIFKLFPEIDLCIISSVVDIENSVLKYISEKVVHLIYFDENTPVPVKNLYDEPKTLGKDRLAGVIGAQTIFPGFPVLVIDMGTAITFDFIDENKNYLGGTISPGLNTRFKALNSFTNRLPLLEPGKKEYLLAKNTRDSIISGVQNGIIFEIEGYISSLQKKYKSLKIIITGGDAPNFVKKLKSPIFAEPNLIFIGLKNILEYNVQK